MGLQEGVKLLIAVPPGYFKSSAPYPYAQSGQKAVPTTVVQVLALNLQRLSVSVKNTGTAIVYVGPASDTTALTGHALGAGEVINLVTPTELWAVAASGTQTLTFLEEMTR